MPGLAEAHDGVCGVCSGDASAEVTANVELGAEELLASCCIEQRLRASLIHAHARTIAL